MKRIKRGIISAVIIVVCFLLESAVFSHLALASVTPNVMLICTAAFGFMRGKKEGLIIGFFSGLLLDIFSGGFIGVYALLYMVIGYCNGFFKHVFYADDIKLPLGLIAGSDIIYGILTYLFYFMLKGDFKFWYYLQHIILPEMIYTVLVTLVIYQIILRINQKLELEVEEQKGASKFV